MRKILFLLAAAAALAAVLIAPSWLRWQQAPGAIPPGVRLAGFNFEDADATTVAHTLEAGYAEPVAVYYGTERLILRPQVVNFQIDVPLMIAEAQHIATPPRLALVFLAQSLNRPVPPIDVPLSYTFDREALDAWLSDVATRYDRSPQAPRVLLDQLTVAPGQPGHRLDIAASRSRIITALSTPQARAADLVVYGADAPALDWKVLGELLQARLKEFPGDGAVFVHDLQTGNEVAINADNAYSGMSTLKVAVLEETFRKLNTAPDPYTSRLISETMTVSGNMTANELLKLVGDGEPAQGVQVLNDSLKTLGLQNTFMAAPYDATLPAPPHVVTAANSQPGKNTAADPYIQTTARDIGRLMEMLVACSQGGGTLVAAYPDRMTPAKCQQALSFMELNDIHELLTAGVPAGTRMAHRQAYGSETHADVAAIWGPGGPYVITAFLHQGPWLEFALSSQTMQDLSRAVWNYYTVVSKK